jgi:hypothetical protein
MPSLYGFVAVQELVKILAIKADVATDPKFQQLTRINQPLEVFVGNLQQGNYLVPLQKLAFIGFIHKLPSVVVLGKCARSELRRKSLEYFPGWSPVTLCSSANDMVNERRALTKAPARLIAERLCCTQIIGISSADTIP